jgi:hypothetical protein
MGHFVQDGGEQMLIACMQLEIEVNVDLGVKS